ncbi:MAG: endolytic transglycosylase MltG [Tidjanibacter sp.]|nr:endolytic transglycosylase MltG [Tidjanibacter sp.]
MRKKARRLRRFVGFMVVVAAVLGGVLWCATKPCTSAPTEFVIPTGSNYSALLDTISSAGVERLGIIDIVGRLKKLDRNPKAGHYVLPEGATPVAVVNMLRSGAQKPVRVTFNNTRTLPQLAGRIASQLEVDSANLLLHLESPATAERYSIRKEEVIGLFIPNTYDIWWNASPEAITERMHREWKRFWNEERSAALARTKLSKMEVITLASIVYEETKNVGEMAKIAGVYINRLRRGMPLQACPTAKYAVGDFTIKRVLHKHTQTPSPYNTYLHRGLPPGPICTPSIAAIDAVLGYTNHNYLYFCAKEDFSGTHHFSTNLSQHNRYAKLYADALRRSGIR